MLRNDLLEKEKNYHDEEKKLVTDRERLAEEAKLYPLKILEKENVMYDLRTTIKDINDKSNDLEQELDQILAENVKDDIEWHDTDRWIEKMYRMIQQRIPFIADDTKEPDSALEQLNKIKEFVSMATEIINRLKLKKQI
nr:uncharacterized protein LOC107456044 isoform X2 [Parasteatoda tepidariorum]